MQQNLVVFKQECSALRGVHAVVEDNGDHLVVSSLDDFFAEQPPREIVRKNTVDFLPLSLSMDGCEREFRVDGVGADEDPSVEIFLVPSIQHSTYNIVRRYKGRDTVLNDGGLTLGRSCDVLAACEAINWQCLFSNIGDVETLCVSNAVAIEESLEAA